MPAQITLEAALAGLGVTDRTLSPAEKRCLDEQGYLLLMDVLTRDQVEGWRAAFEAACAAEEGEGSQRTGTRHAAGLHGCGVFAERIFTYPKLLAAAFHILRRPFRLTGIGGRDPLPGYGAQALHADWRPRDLSEPYYHVNSLWMLDEFTVENGATRVVPGSHRGTGKLPRALSGPGAQHPEEVSIVAPAGSVLIFNAHLLHGGTRNTSRGPRRSLTCSFVARDAQYYTGTASGDLEIGDARHLTPAARYVLGLRDPEG